MDADRTVILHGNPADGFSAYGPFETAEDAVEWASEVPELTNDAWFTMPLNSPGENATPTPETDADMKAALKLVQRAAHGDSNDGEIEALGDALDLALSRWPGLQREFGDPDEED